MKTVVRLLTILVLVLAGCSRHYVMTMNNGTQVSHGPAMLAVNTGSGVFARDPDSVITFTKHEEEKAFKVEMILRNRRHPKGIVLSVNARPIRDAGRRQSARFAMKISAFSSEPARRRRAKS